MRPDAGGGLPPIADLAEWQLTLVQRWHEVPIVVDVVDEHTEPFARIVRSQHECNFRLWHEEDLARIPDSPDAVIARVKRSIDHWNQQRNDAIERLDDEIGRRITASGVSTSSTTPANTETLGSAIDRLSILALRLFHHREELDREDASLTHRQRVQQRLTICQCQRRELITSAQTLATDLMAGRIRHLLVRHLKMYNDADLNPALRPR